MSLSHDKGEGKGALRTTGCPAQACLFVVGGLGGVVVEAEAEKWSKNESKPRITLAPGPAMLWRVAEGHLGFASGLPMLGWEDKGIINKAWLKSGLC
jgi:hypothetical protein